MILQNKYFKTDGCNYGFAIAYLEKQKGASPDAVFEKQISPAGLNISGVCMANVGIIKVRAYPKTPTSLKF